MCIDPLAEKYPYNGVYNFSENRVIDARELEGLESVQITVWMAVAAAKLKTFFNSGLNYALGNTTPNKPTFTVGGINVAKVVNATQIGEAANKKAVDIAEKVAVNTGDAMEKTGDTAVTVAPAFGPIAPEVAEGGEELSKAGTIIKATVDLAKGDYDKALEKIETEVLTGAASSAVEHLTGADRVTVNSVVTGAKNAVESDIEEKTE